MARRNKKSVISSAAELARLSVGTHQVDDFKDLSLLDTAQNYRPVNRSVVDDLKRSILSLGVREPIKVHVILGEKTAFVVAGQHRKIAVAELRADAAALGMNFNYRPLPAVIQVAESFPAEKTTIDATTSNFIGRESIWDRAAKVAKMRSVLGSVDLVADAVSLDKRSVYNALAVHALPDRLKSLLMELGATSGVKDTKVVQLSVKYLQLTAKQCVPPDAAEIIIRQLLQPKPVVSPEPESVSPKPGVDAGGQSRKRFVSIETVKDELSRLKTLLRPNQGVLIDEAINRLATLEPSGGSNK